MARHYFQTISIRWRGVIDPIRENCSGGHDIVLLTVPHLHRNSHLRFYNSRAWYPAITFKKDAKSFVIRVPFATMSQFRKTIRSYLNEFIDAKIIEKISEKQRDINAVYVFKKV